MALEPLPTGKRRARDAREQAGLADPITAIWQTGRALNFELRFQDEREHEDDEERGDADLPTLRPPTDRHAVSPSRVTPSRVTPSRRHAVTPSRRFVEGRRAGGSERQD